MAQTYHIEALGLVDRGPAPVVQSRTVRADAFDTVRAQAIRLLRLSQAPKWEAGPVEAVRVLDGRGSELFRWTRWDELSAPGA